MARHDILRVVSDLRATLGPRPRGAPAVAFENVPVEMAHSMMECAISIAREHGWEVLDERTDHATASVWAARCPVCRERLATLERG